MNKMKFVGLCFMLMMLVLVSCSQKEELSADGEKGSSSEVSSKEESNEVDGISYEGTLKFIGENVDFEVAYNDIYNMDSVTSVVKHISSSGEESTNKVEGVTLESILKSKNLTKDDYTGIRFTAGDGYAITVPADIFKTKDIILAYKFDDKLLEDKQMPLRVAIHDVRSMYYVSNVLSVELITEDTIETSEIESGRIVFLETITATIENEEFMYYDSNDMAVKVVDILAMAPASGTSVKFVASDGYEKEESLDVVTEGFIKTTGIDAPLFTGLDLPIGMNVKTVMTMAIGDTIFVSIQSAIAANETMSIDDYEGVKLSRVIQMAGFDSAFYLLSAADGYSVEVTANSSKDALVYVDESGTTTVKFDSQYPKNTNVKDLLTITVGDGSMTEMKVDEEVTTEVKEEEKTEELWSITFDGLSDGSFDFGSDRAQRKLDLVTLHTKRTKDDQVIEDDWQGYILNDVLAFLRVEDYKSLTIIASDGYEIELMKDQVDSETILATSKNGDVLSDIDNMVQLVQNTEFATTWIKGVTTIIVNN